MSTLLVDKDVLGYAFIVAGRIHRLPSNAIGGG